MTKHDPRQPNEIPRPPEERCHSIIEDDYRGNDPCSQLTILLEDPSGQLFRQNGSVSRYDKSHKLRTNREYRRCWLNQTAFTLEQLAKHLRRHAEHSQFDW